MTSPKLILASRSPRRAALLQEAGYPFEQADPPFEDPPSPETIVGPDAAAHTVELARQKAQSLRPSLHDNALILAADTICVGPAGEWVGTPTSRAEAAAILRSFVGRAHEVVTGLALCRTRDDRWWFDADTATVTWGVIDDDALETYLDSGEWQGKAGAYNLFDRERAGWPIVVDGDAGTVVGLPMRRLVPLLEQARQP